MIASTCEFDCKYWRVQLLVLVRSIASTCVYLHDMPTKSVTHTNDCEYLRVRLRVLASSIASTREFDCKYLRVLASSIVSTRGYDCEYSRVRLWVITSILKFTTCEFRLASFDSRVGNASLVCPRWPLSLALACDTASHTSYSDTFVNLRLSGTVHVAFNEYVIMCALVTQFVLIYSFESLMTHGCTMLQCTRVQFLKINAVKTTYSVLRK